MSQNSQEAKNLHKGSCLCGKVQIEVNGQLKPPDRCHCTQCRKFSGHYFVSTDIHRSSLTVHGQEYVKWFRSSEKAQRGFCSECGSSLFWDPINKDIEWTAVAMGAFVAPTGIKMDNPIFTGSKGDYYEIADGLPAFATTPPRPPAQ